MNVKEGKETDKNLVLSQVWAAMMHEEHSMKYVLKSCYIWEALKADLNCFRATAVQTWSLWDFHLTQVLSGTNVVHLTLRTVCNNKVSGQRGCPAVLRPGCHIVSFGKHNLCNRCPDMILFMEKFICVLQMVLPSYIKMTFDRCALFCLQWAHTMRILYVHQ